MTWSPVSMWGAKIGLCLPRRIFATSEASLPSTAPSASTTYQRRSMSRGRGEKVLVVVVMCRKRAAGVGRPGSIAGAVRPRHARGEGTDTGRARLRRPPAPEEGGTYARHRYRRAHWSPTADGPCRRRSAARCLRRRTGAQPRAVPAEAGLHGDEVLGDA